MQRVPDRRQRGDLAQIAMVFAELAGCFLTWEKELEGWEMTESMVVNRWIEKADQLILVPRQLSSISGRLPRVGIG